jgi:hypothetical protein
MTDIEIEQTRVEYERLIEEQRRTEHQKRLEHQRQVEYHRRVGYQEGVEDQNHQSVRNVAAPEARNIMQPNHLRSFPALSSWDAYHGYTAMNAATLQAGVVMQPDPESSSNQSSWNANHDRAAPQTSADSNQFLSDSIDSLVGDQVQSPPTRNQIYDTHSGPHFGEESSRASRSEGFTTMEELLEYERQHYPSTLYLKQPVRNPVTGMWTFVELPIVPGSAT